MKRTILIVAVLAAALTGPAAGVPQTQTAQLPPADKVTVPLSKPGQPAVIEIDLMFGSIKVVGYEGKDVVVEARPRAKSLFHEEADMPVPPAIAGRGTGLAVPPVPPAPAAPPARVSPPEIAARDYERARGRVRDREMQEEQAKKAKSAGMKQIPLESSGLTVEEDNNTVTVEIESFRRAYDLEIKAPAGSSLKLDGANLDEIRVENVGGEIEVETANGAIKLLNVTGPVTANTTNGDIEVILSRLAPDKPMSFVTFNGDIDVTLPADARANLRIKSNMGNLYSDFDVNLKAAPVEPEKSSGREGGKFRVSLERSVMGVINGGGAELKFQNFQGDIYLRKKK
jgi:hypothetical protein